MKNRLGNATALLDPQSRRVMELWLEGMALFQIATALGLDESNVTRTEAEALRRPRQAVPDKTVSRP